jgi:hypothetical protein
MTEHSVVLDKELEQELPRIWNSMGKEQPPSFHVVFYPYARLTNTIRRRNGTIHIRISDILGDADRPVLRAVLVILLHRICSLPVPVKERELYREYIFQPTIRERASATRRLRGKKHLTSPIGEAHDLDKLFRRLNQEYFSSQLRVRHISWSRRQNRRILGHYDSSHDAIVIDRRLDNPLVPEYVVAYVLYHEMLHCTVSDDFHNGIRRVHHTEFKMAERRFSDYKRARSFLKTHFWGSAPW